MFFHSTLWPNEYASYLLIFVSRENAVLGNNFGFSATKRTDVFIEFINTKLRTTRVCAKILDNGSKNVSDS